MAFKEQIVPTQAKKAGLRDRTNYLSCRRALRLRRCANWQQLD